MALSQRTRRNWGTPALAPLAWFMPTRRQPARIYLPATKRSQAVRAESTSGANRLFWRVDITLRREVLRWVASFGLVVLVLGASFGLVGGLGGCLVFSAFFSFSHPAIPLVIALGGLLAAARLVRSTTAGFLSLALVSFWVAHAKASAVSHAAAPLPALPLSPASVRVLGLPGPLYQLVAALGTLAPAASSLLKAQLLRSPMAAPGLPTFAGNVGLRTSGQRVVQDASYWPAAAAQCLAHALTSRVLQTAWGRQLEVVRSVQAFGAFSASPYAVGLASRVETPRVSQLGGGFGLDPFAEGLPHLTVAAPIPEAALRVVQPLLAWAPAQRVAIRFAAGGPFVRALGAAYDARAGHPQSAGCFVP